MNTMLSPTPGILAWWSSLCYYYFYGVYDSDELEDTVAWS